MGFLDGLWRRFRPQPTTGSLDQSSEYISSGPPPASVSLDHKMRLGLSEDKIRGYAEKGLSDVVDKLRYANIDAALTIWCNLESEKPRAGQEDKPVLTFRLFGTVSGINISKEFKLWGYQLYFMHNTPQGETPYCFDDGAPIDSDFFYNLIYNVISQQTKDWEKRNEADQPN